MEPENPPDRPAGQWNGLIADISVRRDRDAFDQLFQHFAPRLKTYMMRAGLDASAAEDLAQESMALVWRKANLFDPSRGAASTWIFTIARNLRIDAIRRQRRGGDVRLDEIAVELMVDDDPTPDMRVQAAQSEKRVASALGELPPEQIAVIRLSFFENKAHGDIAEALNIPLGTVKSRMRLALGRLRKRLDDLS